MSSSRCCARESCRRSPEPEGGPVDGARVRAPEFGDAGGAWHNTEPLTLSGLRGRLVLLHFWTTGCVNCLRVEEELRALERRFADAIVVVGVHAPKFPHERDGEAVRTGVARLRIEHPVVEDPGLVLWDRYAVRAWPTLVLVDTTGRVALTVAGEGHGAQLAEAAAVLVAEGEAAASLRRGRLTVAPTVAATGELAFPGNVAVDGAGTRLVIADTGHDRVLVTTLSGAVLHELRGLYQPQGVRFDGEDAVLVCETAADRVWRIALTDGARTLLTDRLNAPWDVVRWRGHVVIAEAGRHRLWAIDRDGEIQVIAGTGGENLVDGLALEALLAQPSGLAIGRDEDLVFVDAESSALRTLDRPGGRVRTLVGHGLFVSGEVDGDAERATLQHPGSVACAPDGTLVVADTYNGLLRVWRGQHLWTVPVEGFDEPGGVSVLPDGRVVVADTGHHRVVLVDLSADPPVAVAIEVGRAATAVAAQGVLAGTIVARAGETLAVVLSLELDGDVLDTDGGAPVRVTATADDPALLPGDTSWAFDALPARVAVPLGAGSGRVRVELRAATCGDGLCRLRRTSCAYDVIVT